MNTKLYARIASCVQAHANCIENGNTEWQRKHRDTADSLVESYMPSGSGVDNGTALDWDKSNSEKLVFETAYHHTNDSGMYDGWTEHMVTVRASLWAGIDVAIGGRNRNDIKDYLGEIFHSALTQDVDDSAYAAACGVNAGEKVFP